MMHPVNPNQQITVADTDALRAYYEELLRTNPNNLPAVYYLGIWHLERQSYQQAKRFFGHLTSLKADDVDIWMTFGICAAFCEDYDESLQSLHTAKRLVVTTQSEIRWKFCFAVLCEKKRDFNAAMEGYTDCLNHSNTYMHTTNLDPHDQQAIEAEKALKLIFLKEIRGEVLLRIAILKKEMGALEQSLQMCNSITSEAFNDTIKANALCLKGLLHEIRSEFPASEVVYRSVLQMKGGHATALERLGRVYLRYRETIPAAVQCFFKAVDTNPANHVAWYLLGRCYMATSQYSDACEAYNRAVNLNPNDPQIWCSLGVLYYAFGQYREALGMLARALKLDPTMSDAWYNVGALYDMCDQPDDAQQAYAKAKEHGLADRFTKAGIGMNPLAMQPGPNNPQGTNGSTANGGSSSGGNAGLPTLIGGAQQSQAQQQQQQQQNTVTMAANSVNSATNISNIQRQQQALQQQIQQDQYRQQLRQQQQQQFLHQHQQQHLLNASQFAHAQQMHLNDSR